MDILMSVPWNILLLTYCWGSFIQLKQRPKYLKLKGLFLFNILVGIGYDFPNNNLSFITLTFSISETNLMRKSRNPSWESQGVHRGHNSCFICQIDLRKEEVGEDGRINCHGWLAGDLEHITLSNQLAQILRLTRIKLLIRWFWLHKDLNYTNYQMITKYNCKNLGHSFLLICKFLLEYLELVDNFPKLFELFQ